MKEAQIIKAYEAAKERYAQIGIDTGEALKKLQNISLSLHCNRFRKPGRPTFGRYPGYR